jgi:uncharacterized membrane protein/uncharacterized membrane-anchored protein
MQAHSAPDRALPQDTRGGNDSALAVIAWGLFWRMLFAQAAPLFLLAAIVCFFAFNWADMPDFAKFGVIALLMLASAALALRQGFNSTAGSLSLLFCGLCAGPLLAVYGQVYQTGADAWELFRAWSLLLIPLAILGRRNGLWIALWAMGNLWAALWMRTILTPETLLILLCAGQTAVLCVWETAALFLAGPRRPFLNARWPARVISLPPLAALTALMILYIVDAHSNLARTLGLYLFLLCWGAFHYTHKKRDTLITAYGLLSMVLVAAALPFANLAPHTVGELLVRCAMTLLLLVIGAVATAGILRRYHKASLPCAREPDEKDGPAFFAHMRLALTGKPPSGEAISSADKETPGTLPWTALLLGGLCAWISMPVGACLLILFSQFFDITISTNGWIVLNVFIMILGAVLSHFGQNAFAKQSGLVLALTGTVCAAAVAVDAYGARVSFTPVFLLFTAGGLCVNNSVFRFLAPAIACPALVLSLLYYPTVFGPNDISHTRLLAEALFLVLFCLVPAHVLTRHSAGQESDDVAAWWRPMFAGGCLALLLMGFALFVCRPALLASSTHRPEALITAARIVGAAAGTGLVWFVFRLAGRLALPRSQQCLFVGLSLALAALAWKLPWLGTGIFVLALARQAVSAPLMGLAVLCLTVGVNLEYYLRASTLLEKSVSLGGIGLLSATVAVCLHRLLTSSVRKGRLPDPLLLFSDAARGESSPQNRNGGEAAPVPNGQSAPGWDRFRAPAFALVLVLFFVSFAWSVMRKERLLADGDRIILALAPVDPRSLMQGDYMILRFAVENAIEKAVGKKDVVMGKGVAVVEEGTDRVFFFKRLDDGSDMTDREKRLVFRRLGIYGHVRVGSGSFFFQEGHGKYYEHARFALLRVDGEGESLIIRLLDKDMEIIEAPTQEKSK